MNDRCLIEESQCVYLLPEEKNSERFRKKKPKKFCNWQQSFSKVGILLKKINRKLLFEEYEDIIRNFKINFKKEAT